MAQELAPEAIAYQGPLRRVVWAYDQRGKLPAREFYRSLRREDQKKILALFRRFALHGRIRNPQQFRQLKGEGLSEFKIKGVRFLGGLVDGRTFIVAHALKKKSDRLPVAAFTRARRLLELNRLRYSEVKSGAPN